MEKSLFKSKTGKELTVKEDSHASAVGDKDGNVKNGKRRQKNCSGEPV